MKIIIPMNPGQTIRAHTADESAATNYMAATVCRPEAH